MGFDGVGKERSLIVIQHWYSVNYYIIPGRNRDFSDVFPHENYSLYELICVCMVLYAIASKWSCYISSFDGYCLYSFLWIVRCSNSFFFTLGFFFFICSVIIFLSRILRLGVIPFIDHPLNALFHLIEFIPDLGLFEKIIHKHNRYFVTWYDVNGILIFIECVTKEKSLFGGIQLASLCKTSCKAWLHQLRTLLILQMCPNYKMRSAPNR